jgi:MYXO-CTERM domain-containing protein
MSMPPRRPAVLAVLGALTLALPSAVHAQGSVYPASTRTQAPESGNPINDQGSNFNYRSYITSVVPGAPGLSVQVLEFADRLQLTNRTGRTVTIYGYEGEPYARVLGDGTVEVNTHSPAYYLNQNFYAQVSVPASASAHAAPHWSVVDRAGQFEWHDHRIHWMSPVPPAKIKDKSKRTKIFDWQVPLRVGAQPGAVDGQLYWVPEEGAKTPIAAIVALAAIALLGLALVFVGRRRRRTGGPGDSVKEAW